MRTNDGKAIIPNDAELRKDILDEANKTQYTVHPSSNKMYQHLRKKFWWAGMKRSIAKYMTLCTSCQLVKAEHQRSAGKLQSLEIPKWK